MNILCDFHHSDLWWSHHLIFEKALGHKLYRPRGMEWYQRGFHQQKWEQVAGQYLVSSMFTIEDLKNFPLACVKAPENRSPGLRGSMNHIEGCPDYPLIDTLSFDEFLDAKIDVIMATCTDIQEPWLRLQREFKPNAKLVREEGNLTNWPNHHPDYKNLITSDLPTFLNSKVKNKILYHQRFDIERIFTFTEPTVFNRITSFYPQFRSCGDLVKFAESHDFGGMEFVDYGYFSKRGFLPTKGKFTAEMRATTFVWHVKPLGDGFGHVIHNCFAMGRPPITIPNDYKNSIAWPLMEDGKTCIFIGKDPVENMKKIRGMATPEKITEMARAAAAKFRSVVNYAEELKRIEAFMGSLV